MNANALVLNEATTRAVERMPAGLSERLIWLTRFGKPRVSHTGNGFYAAIEMHVCAVGTTFKIDSDFGMSTPDAAIEQVIERMLNALADIQRAAQS